MKISNELRPNKKPDADNVIKLVADALNEVAYKDDTQIIELECRKFYSNIPRMEITLEDLVIEWIIGYRNCILIGGYYV